MTTTIDVVRVHETGGPEKLVCETLELESPAPREVQIQHDAIGLNFIDTYHRNGLYPIDLPAVIGMEAAGTVSGVGGEVEHFEPGDRVAYGAGPAGAYAEARNIPAKKVVALPEGIKAREAAASMLKGMTVEYLIRRTFEVESGMDVLFHAAAGGVGTIACQWLSDLGATVLGTVSSEYKAERAITAGCDHPIIYTEEDAVERVRDLTEGRGVDVVYDGVGRATLRDSIKSLRRRGMLVAFGNASGAPEPVDPLELSRAGSLYMTRPSLMDYVATTDELVASAKALFDAIERGAVQPEIGQTFPLEDANLAHRALEARKTTGSTVLVPK